MEKLTLSDIERWIHNVGVDVNLATSRIYREMNDIEHRLAEQRKRITDAFDKLLAKIEK